MIKRGFTTDQGVGVTVNNMIACEQVLPAKRSRLRSAACVKTVATRARRCHAQNRFSPEESWKWRAELETRVRCVAPNRIWVESHGSVSGEGRAKDRDAVQPHGSVDRRGSRAHVRQDLEHQQVGKVFGWTREPHRWTDILYGR